MSEGGRSTPATDVEALFGLGVGRVSRGLERIQLARDARLHSGRVAVLLAAVTWLPLFILAAIESVAWGNAVHVPFLRDYLPYGQLLIAIPVLMIGEMTVGRHLIRSVAQLRTAEVLDSDERPALPAVGAV
jgi:hypothetical protein